MMVHHSPAFPPNTPAPREGWQRIGTLAAELVAGVLVPMSPVQNGQGVGGLHSPVALCGGEGGR